jgi:PAS domain-containing protein
VELSEAYGDLTNLVVSLDIGSVLVDNDLRIRRFTPVAQKLLNLIANDIGRPIADIRPKIEIPNWPGVIADVIRTLSPVELELQDPQGHWYSMRIRPYRTESMKVGGAVLLLVDIDNLKRAEAALTQSDERWKELVENRPDFILNPDGQILFINRSVARLTPEAKIGSSIYAAIDPGNQARVRSSLERVRATGEPVSFKTKGGGLPGTTTVETRFTPIKSGGTLVAITLLTKEVQPSASETDRAND